MADSIKVKILEFFGPSKFSVRPNLLEGSFHSLQRQMDQHFFQCNSSQSEERLPMKQGDSVRSVVSSVYPPQCSAVYRISSGSVSTITTTGAGQSSTGSPQRTNNT